MRDIAKFAEEGREVIRPRQTLTVSELQQIIQVYENTKNETGNIYESLWNVISFTFYAGYAIGKNTRKKKRKI